MIKIRRYLSSVFIIFLIWYLLSMATSPVIPYPISALKTFFSEMKSELLIHIGVSLYRIIVSIAWAFLLGVPFGLIMGQEKNLDDIFSTIFFFLYPIPKIVFLPVLLMLLGLGDMPRIILITFIIFFQLTVTARDASKNVNKKYIDSLRSLGGGKWDVYKHVIIPASMPSIFTSLRICVGTALSVLFFTETFATTRGIGYYIMDAWVRVDYKELFAGIIGMSLIGILLFRLLEAVEKRICIWRNESQTLLKNYQK